MTANAAVSSKLSTRSRTLSQRRRANVPRNTDGLDLTGQDGSTIQDRESGLWVPASVHKGGDEYADGDEEEDEEELREASLQEGGGLNGETRGGRNTSSLRELNWVSQ